MFYAKEWRSITEVVNAFRYAADERPTPAEQDASAEVETPKQRRARESQEKQKESRQLMKVLWSLRQIAILLPSGYIAQGTNDIISAPTLKDFKTRHIDLRIGTIGSGTLWDIHWDEEDPAFHRIELERQYGIFLGCPVMVNANEVDNAIRSVFPWHTSGFDLSAELKADRAVPESKMDQPRRRPGNPGRHGGLPRRMVQKHFRPRVAPGGEFASEPRTYVYQRAADWIEELIDEKVPIDTVEDWVRPLYKTQVGN